MVVGVPVVRTNAVLAEHLPDGLGQTLLERIRLDPALEATQMIVVSAHASEHSWKAAQGAGVRAFLNKPLQIAEVVREIDAALAGT